MDYWETKADREWSQAYDFCDFPNSDLLTKKMFVEANANNTEPLEYKSVNITDVKQLTGDAGKQAWRSCFDIWSRER